MRVRPWQVCWASLDPTEGREQRGRRPVLVVSSSFHLALTGGDLVTVLPLTTRERPGWLHRVALKGTGTRETSFVITEQLRTVSASRLSPPAETLDSEQIEEVRRILRKMLDLP